MFIFGCEIPKERKLSEQNNGSSKLTILYVCNSYSSISQGSNNDPKVSLEVVYRLEKTQLKHRH